MGDFKKNQVLVVTTVSVTLINEHAHVICDVFVLGGNTSDLWKSDVSIRQKRKNIKIFLLYSNLNLI